MAEKPYTNREEAKEYALKILSDLTPGGSEFFEAPVACANYIRKTRDDLQEMLKREILRRKNIRRETIEECIKEVGSLAYVDFASNNVIEDAVKSIRALKDKP